MNIKINNKGGDIKINCLNLLKGKKNDDEKEIDLSYYFYLLELKNTAIYQLQRENCIKAFDYLYFEFLNEMKILDNKLLKNNKEFIV